MTWNLFRVFNRYLIPYWSLEALVLLTVLLVSLLSLLGPALFGITIDRAFMKHDLYLFQMLLLAGLLLTVLQAILSTIQSYLTTYIGRMLTFDLRRDYTRHLFRLSFSDFHRRPTGEQIYRLDTDLDTAAGLASESIPQIIITASRLIFLLAICLYLDWPLTLVAVLISPLFYLQSIFFGRRQKAVTRIVKQESQDATTMIQDALSNIKLIKAFGRDRWAVRRYLHHRLMIIRATLQRARIGIAGNLTAGLLNSIALLGFSYYLGSRVIRGSLSLGEMVAMTIYLTQLFVALKGLGSLYRGVMVKLVSWERVQETMGLPLRKEKPAARSTVAVRGAVRFRSVTFGYLPDRTILGDISFKIESGQFIGIAGPSGSGKTTLLLLLLRLIDPRRGEIEIDGVPLNEIHWPSLQPDLGIALQEAFLLNRSIAENLRFGRPDATEGEMRMALTAADLDDMLRVLDAGLDSIVGEAGSSLSEGQRQRLNIARAIIGRPRILILDEATAAVGFDSEARILSRLRDFLPRSTIIFATHRLGALTAADKILVLKEGRLAEEGSHRDLMERNGFYRFLYREECRRPGGEKPR